MSSHTQPVRILFVPPTAKDASVTREILARAGLELVSCRDLAAMREEIVSGAGALLLTEDILTVPMVEGLIATLGQEPSWSEIPIVMMMHGGVDSPAAIRVLSALKNVTFLERPAPMRSLVSALQAAVRARLRQYQIRDLLHRERAARREAERISRTKDEFLATLSHELRTPLNAIFGWTQVLKRGTPNPELVSQGISVIDRNVRTQTQLVEDLLDMSRIVSGKIHLDPRDLDIEEVISSAIQSVRPAAENRRVSLEHHTSQFTKVRADPERLQQILWNLLTNAVKFTGEGGSVFVSARREGELVVIDVTDTGEGIDADFLPHLFERFSQADGSIKRKFGGLGIGLSLVKSLVEMQGGNVSVFSDGPGLGSTFTVRLPGAAAEGDAPSGLPDSEFCACSDEAPLSGIEVLIVDDEKDSREVIARTLTGYGARSRLASSASEAEEALAASIPDIILSDIGMPGTDGLQFMRDARRRGISIPAIAVSAFARPEDRERSLKAGYQSHLSKPFDAIELVQIVARLLDRPEAAHSYTL